RRCGRGDRRPNRRPIAAKAGSPAAREGERIGFFGDCVSTTIVVVASLCDDNKELRTSCAICQNTGRPLFFATPPISPKKLDVLCEGGVGGGAFDNRVQSARNAEITVV